ncbi:hypothetical protein BURK_002285 [Burkholderia sp. SJ98]|nr:hypothetical protein BURK_002285 [Burkholderia sp. SJ98]
MTGRHDEAVVPSVSDSARYFCDALIFRRTVEGEVFVDGQGNEPLDVAVQKGGVVRVRTTRKEQ